MAACYPRGQQQQVFVVFISRAVVIYFCSLGLVPCPLLFLSANEESISTVAMETVVFAVTPIGAAGPGRAGQDWAIFVMSQHLTHIARVARRAHTHILTHLCWAVVVYFVAECRCRQTACSRAVRR